MKNPVIVALDVDDAGRAEKLVEDLGPYVGGFKIGPRLTFKVDRSFLRRISDQGILFFDHKFFDIPTSTVNAVKMASDLGAHWVTVHALAGLECLKELKKLEREIQKSRSSFRVAVVTVLTSFTKESLPPVWNQDSLEMSAKKLAMSADQAGLETLVCSPEEVRFLRQTLPQGFFIVPGIRPLGALSQDQKRTALPRDALKDGASALIIGRPIIDAPSPVEAARAVVSSLER